MRIDLSIKELDLLEHIFLAAIAEEGDESVVGEIQDMFTHITGLELEY